MNEWYVFSEGGKPFEVCLGRRQAVDRLLAPDAEGRKYQTTPAERRQITLFMEGVVCDLGSGLLLVGLVRDTDHDPVPDRRITRVIGPGATV